jgi:hypothetical protein
MTLRVLVALILAFSEVRSDESAMISLRSLFTGVRGRQILRNSLVSGSAAAFCPLSCGPSGAAPTS